MAKKIEGYLKLQVLSGQASAAPPVGPALGQRGISIPEFVKAFNAATQNMEPGMPIPTTVTVYADRSFSLDLKQPPASFLIMRAAKLKKGSQMPGRDIIGRVSRQQLAEIAEMKMVDLNANDVDAAVNILAGSARSMGLDVTE